MRFSGSWTPFYFAFVIMNRLQIAAAAVEKRVFQIGPSSPSYTGSAFTFVSFRVATSNPPPAMTQIKTGDPGMAIRVQLTSDPRTDGVSATIRHINRRVKHQDDWCIIFENSHGNEHPFSSCTSQPTLNLLFVASSVRDAPQVDRRWTLILYNTMPDGSLKPIHQIQDAAHGDFNELLTSVVWYGATTHIPSPRFTLQDLHIDMTGPENLTDCITARNECQFQTPYSRSPGDSSDWIFPSVAIAPVSYELAPHAVDATIPGTVGKTAVQIGPTPEHGGVPIVRVSYKIDLMTPDRMTLNRLYQQTEGLSILTRLTNAAHKEGVSSTISHITGMPGIQNPWDWCVRLDDQVSSSDTKFHCPGGRLSNLLFVMSSNVIDGRRLWMHTLYDGIERKDRMLSQIRNAAEGDYNQLITSVNWLGTDGISTDDFRSPQYTISELQITLASPGSLDRAVTSPGRHETKFSTPVFRGPGQTEWFVPFLTVMSFNLVA